VEAILPRYRGENVEETMEDILPRAELSNFIWNKNYSSSHLQMQRSP
jgi:hypothetical protein